METEDRITKHNYNEMMPNAQMNFASLIIMSFMKHRIMVSPNSNIQIRYLYYEDIISVMERKVRDLPSIGEQNIKLRIKWNNIIQLAMKMKNQKG